VVSFVGPVEYVLSHRGVTHSLLLLPAWALLYSWILAKLLREPGGWRALYGVTALALGAHIAGDLITSFGTMIFAPLSDWRAGIGTTFIIDLWLSGILLAGLGLSILFRHTRIPAVVASVSSAATSLSSTCRSSARSNSASSMRNRRPCAMRRSPSTRSRSRRSTGRYLSATTRRIDLRT
jgi:hypothetical protein